jgi:hypothetical protein
VTSSASSSVVSGLSEAERAAIALQTPARSKQKAELRRILLTLSCFLLIQAVIWVIFYAIYQSLPYARLGHMIIYSAKVDAIRAAPIFPPHATNRVVIFGNSRVLCGFDPDLFDSLCPPGTRSYNMGLPDTVTFIDALESLASKGQAPTHALLTLPWPENAFHRTVLKPFESDQRLITDLFPFRGMPRDLTMFAARSRQHGGMVNFYHYGQDSVRQMLSQRGFYYIKEQAAFPDHRLPDDYRFEWDDPTKPNPRNVVSSGSEFERLRRVLEQHHIQCFLVPSYFRPAECAPAPTINQQAVEALRPYPSIQVLGPDYFIFPNRLFSDHQHVNPDGADLYTRKLAELVRPHLSDGSTARTGEGK